MVQQNTLLFSANAGFLAADKTKEVIKESNDSPHGWKIVSEPLGEPQLEIHSNDDNWSTEWTSRAIGKGKHIGAVPDFLKELSNENHGPDFDYLASFDNSNEKADESDYHFKTPLDSHDFLSHHQNPKTVQLSDKKEWEVPHNRVLAIQKNEAELDTARRKAIVAKRKEDDKLLRMSSKKSTSKKNDIKGKVSNEQKESANKSKKLDKMMINMMNKSEKTTSTGIKNRRLDPQDPRSHREDDDIFAERNSRDNDKLVGNKLISNKKDMSNKAIAAQEVSIPLEKIVRGLVSGVQGILQLKKGSKEPVKGSWALSYKGNSSKKDTANKNKEYLEANNMLLKFNNSNENQEDWSLLFHRGRADIKSKATKTKLKETNVVNYRTDNLKKGKRKSGKMGAVTPTDKGWTVFKLGALDSRKKKGQKMLQPKSKVKTMNQKGKLKVKLTQRKLPLKMTKSQELKTHKKKIQSKKKPVNLMKKQKKLRALLDSKKKKKGRKTVQRKSKGKKMNQNIMKKKLLQDLSKSQKYRTKKGKLKKVRLTQGKMPLKMSKSQKLKTHKKKIQSKKKPVNLMKKQKKLRALLDSKKKKKGRKTVQRKSKTKTMNQKLMKKKLLQDLSKSRKYRTKKGKLKKVRLTQGKMPLKMTKLEELKTHKKKIQSKKKPVNLMKKQKKLRALDSKKKKKGRKTVQRKSKGKKMNQNIMKKKLLQDLSKSQKYRTKKGKLKKVRLTQGKMPLKMSKSQTLKTHKKLQSRKKPVNLMKKQKTKKQKSTKTILPTDEGWSVFKANKTTAVGVESNTKKLIPKSKVYKENDWIELQRNNSKKEQATNIIHNKDGWVESVQNDVDPMKDILKKNYVKAFQPAKVVTFAKQKLQDKNKTKVGKKADINKKLLKDNNKEEENTNMLEDDKEQIQRNLKKGNVIDVTKKANKGTTKVKSLKHPKEEKKEGDFSFQQGKSKIEKVMKSIRKAGLDSPKNQRKVKPPKPKAHKQKNARVSIEMNNLLERSSGAKAASGGENDTVEKDDNKTAREANLQASLHESLQSAMSGIVKVFNNKVDGHSVMAAKGSLSKEANEKTKDVKDKQQRDISDKKLDFANITWTPWSQWGSCSVSCGRGWITRRRFCLTVTRKCAGRAIEMKFCHQKPCPGEWIVLL